MTESPYSQLRRLHEQAPKSEPERSEFTFETFLAIVLFSIVGSVAGTFIGTAAAMWKAGLLWQ